ncbi:hypothetical protein D3C81_1857160 [compost metagenome]
MTRCTVAVLLTIAFRASAARVERASWIKLSMVEIATISAITPAANRSSVAYEMIASTVSSRLNGLR